MKKLLNIGILKRILDDNFDSDIKIKTAINKKIKDKDIYPDSDLVNAVDTPFIVLNMFNKVIFLNFAAKKELNLSKEDNIFYIFRRPEFRNNIISFRASKKRKSNFLLELFSIPDTKFYDIKLYKIPNDNILLSFVDITRLQKLENLRTDFIGNVSHELKTPLSTIMNIIELFNNQNKITSDEKKNFMDILDKETLKMKSIIEDLLNLTKIETDLNKKITRNVNLDKILRDSINSLRTKAIKNKIKLKYKGFKSSNIIGDSLQLNQMVVNILDNSIKYAKKNSTVEITLKNNLNKLILTFKDKGKGIPHSLIPRITERFYRVPEMKIKNIEGTGLGLAIVKHILIRHNAKFDITSKVNVGTKIEIFFKKI